MTEEKKEKVVLCPINPKWLEETYKWMPPEIWERSRLKDLEACIKKALREER